MSQDYKRHTGRDLFWVLLVVLLGAAVRFHFLVRNSFVIDADEAIVGLMAKHIMEGKSWPIFYYGQPYMGSLEAIITAGLFSVFSRSNIVLHLTPLCFSLIFIAQVYFLARHFTDRSGARLASLFAALGPSALIEWSVKARGGFIELVVIGTAALILCAEILKSDQLQRRRILLLGGLLGLGWWVNNQIIFYLVPIGLVLAFSLSRRLGFRETSTVAVYGLGAFFIGGLPFWYANCFVEPRFDSFRFLGRGAGTISDVWLHLRGFFSESVPILFGARQFWSEQDIFPGAERLLNLLIIVVLVTVSYQWLYAPDGLFRAKSRFSPTRRPFGLLLLFALTTPLIFACSGFGWLTLAPRYLLPLYSVFFVFLGLSASSLWRATISGTTALSIALVSLFLVINMSSNYAHGGAIPGEPFVFAKDRVAKDQQELYAWLTAENYAHILTDYWIGYRVAFETDERITFSLFGQPKTLRIPDYELRRPKEQEDLVYVLVPTEAKLVAQGFSELGLKFRRTELSAYVILDQIRPGSEALQKIEITPEQLHSKFKQELLSRMIDGDLGTRWGTGNPQRFGMTVEISFPEAVAVAGLSIDLGFWEHDYARALLVEGEEQGKDRDGVGCVLLNKLNNEALDYVLADQKVWNIFFPARKLNKIRLTQLGSDEIFDWSIAELTVYSALR